MLSQRIARPQNRAVCAVGAAHRHPTVSGAGRLRVRRHHHQQQQQQQQHLFCRARLPALRAAAPAAPGGTQLPPATAPTASANGSGRGTSDATGVLLVQCPDAKGVVARCGAGCRATPMTCNRKRPARRSPTLPPCPMLHAPARSLAQLLYGFNCNIIQVRERSAAGGPANRHVGRWQVVSTRGYQTRPPPSPACPSSPYAPGAAVGPVHRRDHGAPAVLPARGV